MRTNRIDQKFQSLRASNQKAFVAYIGAGDPNLKGTAALVREFDRVGVDVVELGIPFSDPLADGIVNQMAAERGLKSGTSLDGVLDTVAGLRKEGCQIPVVFYLYYNLVHCHGIKKFARDAAAAGVDGVLTLDLPPEEAAEHTAALKQAGVHPIYLIAPTTPEARVREIAAQAGGFIYYVSREGVTGVQQSVSNTIAPMVKTIRKHTDLPIAVGFGISNPEQAATVAGMADGAVVGSAIVNRIAKLGADKAMATKVGRFVSPMVKAVHAS
jgi:tryptophan synthase alpha chain